MNTISANRLFRFFGENDPDVVGNGFTGRLVRNYIRLSNIYKKFFSPKILNKYWKMLKDFKESYIKYLKCIFALLTFRYLKRKEAADFFKSTSNRNFLLRKIMEIKLIIERGHSPDYVYFRYACIHIPRISRDYMARQNSGPPSRRLPAKRPRNETDCKPQPPLKKNVRLSVEAEAAIILMGLGQGENYNKTSL